MEIGADRSDSQHVPQNHRGRAGLGGGGPHAEQSCTPLLAKRCARFRHLRPLARGQPRPSQAQPFEPATDGLASAAAPPTTSPPPDCTVCEISASLLRSPKPLRRARPCRHPGLDSKPPCPSGRGRERSMRVAGCSSLPTRHGVSACPLRPVARAQLRPSAERPFQSATAGRASPRCGALFARSAPLPCPA